MIRPQNQFRLVLWTAAEAAAALIVLLLIPSDEKNAAWLGFSPARLLMLAALLLACLGAGLLASRLRQQSQLLTQAAQNLARHPALLLLLLMLLWVGVAAGAFLLLLMLWRNAWGNALYQRLAPLLVFTGLASAQILWLLFRLVPPEARRHLAARLLSPLLRQVERPLAWLGLKLRKGLTALGSRRAWQKLAALLNEPVDYVWIALFFLATYLVAGFFVPDLLAGVMPGDRESFLQRFFGFSQLRHLGLPLTAAWFAAVLLLMIWVQRRREAALRLLQCASDALFSSPAWPLLFSLLAGALYFALRSHFLNADALELEEKILRDVPLLGAHVTHDEMWELYLHSRFWFYTNRWFGWTVYFSYQVLSAVGGAFFTWFLLHYCRLLQGDKALALFLLVCSGAFMQLFFGDIENYTLAAACIMAYFYCSALYLRGRLRLEVVSGVLALAMTFHLLAGFLLPSLAYLYYRALRQREDASILRGLLVFGAIIGAALLFFHNHGLPIQSLFSRSHAFGAVSNPLWYLSPASPTYYWDQFNLALLLFPGLALLPLLMLFRRLPLHPLNVHLLLASFVMLAFQLLWRAQLGVYDDWNLYASAALTLSLLVWTNAMEVPALKKRPAVLVLLWAVFAAHSLGWLLYNHFYPGWL